MAAEDRPSLMGLLVQYISSRYEMVLDVPELTRCGYIPVKEPIKVSDSEISASVSGPAGEGRYARDNLIEYDISEEYRLAISAMSRFCAGACAALGGMVGMLEDIPGLKPEVLYNIAATENVRSHTLVVLRSTCRALHPVGNFSQQCRLKGVSKRSCFESNKSAVKPL